LEAEKREEGDSVNLVLPSWFKDTLDDLVEMAKTVGTDWMLLGAVPVSYYGWPRATTDLDFAIAVDISVSDFIDRWMASRGYTKRFGPSQIQQKGIWLSKYWKETDEDVVGIDVFFSVGEWQKKALERRVMAEVAGHQWWIPSLEDLILYKLIAYREKDILDLEGIWDRSFGKIDWDYLEPWVKKLDLETDLREILETYGRPEGR
jgi:hypothetical protein